VEELLPSAIECTGASDVTQTKMHTSEPFVPETCTSEDEIAIGKLKRYKLPGVDRFQQN
jgi:hypothetical protein